jgi:hypothetical protein
MLTHQHLQAESFSTRPSGKRKAFPSNKPELAFSRKNWNMLAKEYSCVCHVQNADLRITQLAVQRKESTLNSVKQSTVALKENNTHK